MKQNIDNFSTLAAYVKGYANKCTQNTHYQVILHCNTSLGLNAIMVKQQMWQQLNIASCCNQQMCYLSII